MTWDGGHLALAPPLASQHPKVSAAAAYAAAGAPGGEDAAQLFYGRFTDTEMGYPGPNGLVVHDRPAWVVWHHRARVLPRCGASPAGAPTVACGPIIENTLTTIDANTGKPMDGYTF
jgi:hypothetical protein